MWVHYIHRAGSLQHKYGRDLNEQKNQQNFPPYCTPNIHIIDFEQLIENNISVDSNWKSNFFFFLPALMDNFETPRDTI